MKTILTAIVAAAAVGSAFCQDRYREPYRPQFHFTPAKNWMNDPNGMVSFDGEYHLFYQHNPFGDEWGHMSWGHAVSRDLTHWEHLPLAIPEADNVMIFSGSAVVDWHNTSGFGEDGKPPLVAIYTGHHTDKKRQDQRIAFSTDRGRSWTNFSENPVLDLRVADFRDPKVSWHEPSKQWVMVVSIPIERKVGFYASPDLKHWRPLSEFGSAGSTEGIWECPDLFPLGGKWVLIVNVGGGAPAGGSGCQYFVGEFDGRTFAADKRTHPVLTSAGVVPEGSVFADFEDGYGEWQKTGDAFGDAPARGALDGQMAVDGFLGNAFANSFHNTDRGTGTLTSPEFEITAGYINFLIGGGAHYGKTCVNLVIDGKVARSATGIESERLAWRSWDVRALRGSTAKLQIVDAETEGWGHINIDHILFSDGPATVARPTALWADYGRDFYAAVSWSDIPSEDGRRIWIGWMSNWQYAQDVPTSPWRSAMTVPRTLSLRDTPGGYRLVQSPVKELQNLRSETQSFAGGSVAAANEWLASRSAQLVDAEIVCEDPAGKVVVTITSAGEAKTIIRARKSVLTLDRRNSGAVDFHAKFPGEHSAPLRRETGEPLTLRLLIDTSSVEVFANGGESVISDLIFPPAGEHTLSLQASPESKIKSIRFSSLKSAW